MLKIPHDVVVFRCPRCASKLRAPAMHASPSSDVRRATGAISFGFEEQKPSSKQKQEQKRSAFDEDAFLFARRARGAGKTRRVL
jgi:hypothetical protein